MLMRLGVISIIDLERLSEAVLFLALGRIPVLLECIIYKYSFPGQNFQFLFSKENRFSQPYHYSDQAVRLLVKKHPTELRTTPAFKSVTCT